MSEVPSGGPENESWEASSGSDTPNQGPRTAGFERPEDYHKRIDPTRPKTVLTPVSHPEAQRFVPFRPPKFITKDIKNYTQGFVKPSFEIANATKEKFLVGFTNVTSQEKLRYQSAQAKQVVLEIDRAEKSGGFDASSLMSWLNFRIDHKFREVAGEDPNVKGTLARHKAWIELRKLEMWRDTLLHLATEEPPHEDNPKKQKKALKEFRKRQEKFVKQQHRRFFMEMLNAFAWEKSIRIKRLGIDWHLPAFSVRRGTRINEKQVTANANMRRAARQAGMSPEDYAQSQKEQKERQQREEGAGEEERGEEEQMTSEQENDAEEAKQSLLKELDEPIGDVQEKPISAEQLMGYLSYLRLPNDAKIEASQIQFDPDRNQCTISGKIKTKFGTIPFSLLLGNNSDGYMIVLNQDLKAGWRIRRKIDALRQELPFLGPILINQINPQLSNNACWAIGVGRGEFWFGVQPLPGKEAAQEPFQYERPGAESSRPEESPQEKTPEPEKPQQKFTPGTRVTWVDENGVEHSGIVEEEEEE